MASEEDTKAQIIDALRDISFRGRLLRQYRIASLLEPVPINERDEVVLQLILALDTVTETHVARLLGLSLSTVGEMIKRLTELGFVTKLDKGERDSRQRPLKLTTEGEKLVEGVRAFIVDAASYLTKGFKTEQLDQVLRIFEAMQQNAIDEMNKILINPFSQNSKKK